MSRSKASSSSSVSRSELGLEKDLAKVKGPSVMVNDKSKRREVSVPNYLTVKRVFGEHQH